MKGLDTVLIASAWTFLVAALTLDAMSWLMHPSNWWGPLMTLTCAILYAPMLVIGYGLRLFTGWWNR